MPKKASTERGYMTKEEVYSKLDGLKTEKGKLNYMDRVLSKKGLLAPQTYNTIRKVADEIYGRAAVEAAGREWYKDAKKLAEKAGEYLKRNHPDILADIYEETGEVIKAKDIRKRLEAKGKKK